MRRRIPPLNPLSTFEVAARNGSFTLAAEELNVTQGAVSRQVRALEEFLDLELFERHHRSVRLTRAGQDYYADIKAGFEHLEAATARLAASRARETLVVRSYSTFATRWLIPRLPKFNSANPKISIEFTASVREVNFDQDDVDMAVHFGILEDRPDLIRHLLLPVAITPVCSPALLKSEHPLVHPNDLQHHTLLHTMVRPDDWQNWLAAVGISAEWVQQGYRFESSGMAYEAAIKGVGVAIAVRDFVLDDIKEGSLVAPFDMALSTPYSYWLVYPPRKATKPSVQVFQAWILDEARKYRANMI
jgi:LysR family glycine cleavage system transcriptional activator